MLTRTRLLASISQLQADQARLSGHHSRPHEHGGGYGPPLVPSSSASAYTSGFASYPQPSHGRPGHHHQISGGSIGSDRSNLQLTPVGSGFPPSAFQPPHPTLSAASSHYPHPDLFIQPPSPHPFDHVPTNGNPFVPAMPGAMPPFESGAFLVRDPPPHLPDRGPRTLEPSPLIGSPLDPAFNSFLPDNGIERTSVGPIGSALEGGVGWQDGGVTGGPGYQQHQHQ